VRPLRVLVGMPFGEALGGAEGILRTLARHGPSQGLELSAVFFSPGGLERELATGGIPTKVVPLRRFRNVGTGVRATAAVRRLVLEREPDLVLGWLPRAHVYLSAAATLARSGARLAWWQHHTPSGEAFERLVTALPATGIVCESEAAAEAQRALRPRRRCLVSHPGIEPVTPLPEAELRALRERLAIPAGRTIVGLPGRLVRWKGQDRFLRALALLRDAGQDVHGLVVGGSAHGLEREYADELTELTRSLRLEDRCTFTGQVPDARPYVQLMDVLVNASLGEPFGLTLLEAMSAGVPIVAVDRGGPREIVRHGEEGWLVPDGEPATLAEAIGRLAADPQLRASLAERGRARFESTFTGEAFAERAAGALRALAYGDGTGVAPAGTPRR
jgi:glycosyltransferase involved in cell wall biosynthesis